MDNNKVSIITPLYNCEKYITDTFNSVINQTYKNWEWIIVDDCSSDNSLNLIKKLAKNYENIKIISLKKNSGPCVARNKGLDIATGDYVCFLDSDDMLDATMFEKQIKFISQNDYDIVYCSFRRLTDKSCSDYIVPKISTYKSILKGNPFFIGAVIYRLKTFSKERFREDLYRSNDREDYAFWLSLLKKGYIAYANQEVLCTYRIVKNSRSSNKFKMIIPQWRIYFKIEKLGFFKSIYYLFCWVVYGLKKYKNVK